MNEQKWKTKECGLEDENPEDIQSNRPLVDEKQRIRDYWIRNPSMRAKAQTNREWLGEYATGIPAVTVRLVKDNPIADWLEA